MSLYKLSEAPKKTEHVYRVAYDCCKNARARRQKKEQQTVNRAMTMEVAELVQEQPEGAVVVGEVYDEPVVGDDMQVEQVEPYLSPFAVDAETRQKL